MRFVSLDVIRCMAIALLLLAHIAQVIGHPVGGFFGIPHFYYVTLGGFAVTLFLILSGIVLELQHGTSHIHYTKFLVKRFFRIYPTYYLSLFVGIIIFVLRSYAESGHALSGFSSMGMKDIALSVTGGYAFAGMWGGPFVATSWFIGLIMAMHALFPFLSRIIKLHPFFSLGILMLISVLSRLILGRYEIFPERPLDWFPFCRIFEFSLGIYLAASIPRISWDFVKPSRILDSIISSMSEISFPLFLIHHPLLILIPYLRVHDVKQIPAIVFYILISVGVSWLILVIDKRIPRPSFIQRIAIMNR